MDLIKFFKKIDPKLTSSIPNASKKFQNFVTTPEKLFEESILKYKEFEKPSKSLKLTRSPGIDDISSSVVNIFLKILSG